MSLCADNVDLKLGSAVVLTDVSIEIPAGQVTAVIGPNGAGKSSLLRVLSGELEPTAGIVRLDGKSLNQLSAAQQACRRSVMLQAAPMSFDFDVEEVLAMGWVRGDRAALRGAALREVITKCGIERLMGRRFNTLSGGERQRVHFARALLQVWRASTGRGALNSTNSTPAPRYMLLDEPTASLDLAHQLSVLRLARQASEGNIGVLTVLHDLNLAARFADRVVLLAQGAVLAAGAPSAVLTNELLGRIYKTPVRVEKHRQLDRLVVYTE